MRRDDVKYEVYKKSDRAFEDNAMLDPDSYFVIRQSDIFGSAALWGYAHQLQTAVELGHQRPGVFSSEELERLTNLASLVAEKAEGWAIRGGTKAPD